MGTSGFLTITQQSLFGLEAPTISILSIFFSSLLLWLFVATDWPSVLCYVMLGIGMLPGVNYGQIFSLSFGNTTFVFLLFTFLMTYALEQTPALRRFVARALGSSFAGKSPWHFIGAFYASVLAISLFISPTILFMIVFPIYEEIMGGQRGFGAPDCTFCHGGNRYCDDANQPRLLCDCHGALQECDRNRDFQRAIYDDWHSSRTRALYRDVGCS